MYLIQLGGVVYEPKDGREGFTLPEAMREVYGVAGAWILRLDGTVAVMSAGSASEVMHLARRRTGESTERVTRVRRGPARRHWLFGGVRVVETWTSPNGVDHVSVNGHCVTCGLGPHAL